MIRKEGIAIMNRYCKIICSVLVAVLLITFTCATFSFDTKAEETLVNLFPRTADYISYSPMDGYSDKTETSDYISVNENDVIYIAPALLSQTTVQMTTYDDAKISVGTLLVSDLTIVEDIGNNYAIVSYTVPSSVSYVTVTFPFGVYNDGDSFVTLNQKFNGVEYRAAVGIDEVSEEVKSHELYGKKVLFLGDSQVYGSYDNVPSYRNPNTSWARRFIQQTGIVATNVGVGGASGRRSGLSHRSWIYDQLSPHLDEEYDMVIIAAGENDAQDFAEYGEVLPADTDPAALQDNVSTYAGGLQWTMHSIKAAWPEAEILFIAHPYRKNYATGRVHIAEGYYERARRICEIYDAHYVHLYKDEEVESTVDSANREYFPDKVHMSAKTYDLLFPIILRRFMALLDETAEAPKTTGIVATTAGLLISTNKDVAKNMGVKLDDKGLSNSSFTPKSENDILVKKECLWDLTQNDHSLTILYTNGQIEIDLSCVKKSDKEIEIVIDNIPYTFSASETVSTVTTKTAEGNFPIKWFAISALLITLVAAFLIIRRRIKQ